MPSERLGLGLEEANRQYGEYAFALTLFSLPPSFSIPSASVWCRPSAEQLGQADRRTARRHTRTALAVGAAAGAAVGDRAVRSGGACPAAAVPRSGADRRCRRPHLRVLGLAAVCVCLMVVSGGILQAWGHEHIPVVTLAHRRGGEDCCQLSAGVGPRLGHPGRRRGNTALLCAYCGDEPTGGGTHHRDSLSLGVPLRTLAAVGPWR